MNEMHYMMTESDCEEYMGADGMPVQPQQCSCCGRYATKMDLGKEWLVRLVDSDPGDPEVGPQPNIGEAMFCPSCLYK